MVVNNIKFKVVGRPSKVLRRHRIFLRSFYVTLSKFTFQSYDLNEKLVPACGRFVIQSFKKDKID